MSYTRSIATQNFGFLLKAFRMSASHKRNFFINIKLFRNENTFLRVKKQCILSIDEKLTTCYSTQVDKENNLVDDENNLVNEEVLFENLDEDLNEGLDEDENHESYESMFKTISNGDPTIERKLKIIEFELVMFMEKENLEFKVKKHQWEELLLLDSVPKREKYYKYLRINELKSLALIRKKQERLESQILKSKEEAENSNMVYNLKNNSMFVRFFEPAVNRGLNFRLIDSRLYLQNIIFDCSYESYMSVNNAKYCARQLLFSLISNRFHKIPFHLEFCNVDKSSITMKQLQLLIPGIFDDNLIADFYEGSYLDLYPKEKFVYLTPHTANELIEYNHEDIYIIGAFVDKGIGVKASLAKAKESNIRMAKLPLDYFLTWKSGGKSLPINIVLDIMLEMRLFNDWMRAFKHIPQRKLRAHEPW